MGRRRWPRRREEGRRSQMGQRRWLWRREEARWQRWSWHREEVRQSSMAMASRPSMAA
jgi:transposase